MSLKTFAEYLKDDQNLAIRLAFIDFRIFYTGFLSRIDIMNEFDVSEITATRIISEYKKIRENNISYDTKSKRFVLTEQMYHPLVNIGAEDALKMLAEGFDKNKIIRGRNIINFEYIGFIPAPLNREYVAIITRAIFNQNKISVKYNSATSKNEGDRTLSPLVILFDGRNWMFRAYHEDSDTNIKYKNFNFARLLNVKKKDDSIDHEFSLDYDDLWNLNLPLELKINPEFNEIKKDEIRRDFGIESEETVLMSARAAFIWIILNQWMVQYGEKEGNSKGYNFCLNNEDMLRIYKAIS